MNKYLYLLAFGIVNLCPFVASTCYLTVTDVVCVNSAKEEFISFAQNLRENVDTLYLYKPQMSIIDKHMLNFPHLKTIQKLTFERSEILEIDERALDGYTSLKEFNIYENSGHMVITMRTFVGATNLNEFLAYNSHIEYIEPGSFINTPNLARLILYYNSLETLEMGSFIGLQNLNDFEISRGTLKHIEPGAFFGLDKMLYLSLEMNDLTYLEDDTFQGMEKLDRLNLNGNNFRSLNYVAFRGLIHLTYLDLRYTGISQVDMNELKRYMPKLETVTLT